MKYLNNGVHKQDPLRLHTMQKTRTPLIVVCVLTPGTPHLLVSQGLLCLPSCRCRQKERTSGGGEDGVVQGRLYPQSQGHRQGEGKQEEPAPEREPAELPAHDQANSKHGLTERSRPRQERNDRCRGEPVQLSGILDERCPRAPCYVWRSRGTPDTQSIGHT